jgi:hypothetical protein
MRAFDPPSAAVFAFYQSDIQKTGFAKTLFFVKRAIMRFSIGFCSENYKKQREKD